MVSEGCFWPLTASITSEVKNYHTYVTTQRILNKFIEVNLSVGCVVWPWCCLFQPLTCTSKTIRSFIPLVSCTESKQGDLIHSNVEFRHNEPFTLGWFKLIKNTSVRANFLLVCTYLLTINGLKHFLKELVFIRYSINF